MKDAIAVAMIAVMGLIIAGLLVAVITLSLRIGEIPTRDEMDRKFSELRMEIRESNSQLLQALGQHEHAEDGSAIFTQPPGAKIRSTTN